MQRYKEYSPTAVDTPGLLGDHHNISEYWVVPTGRNRDSGILEESNFEAALEILGGESENVQVHSFGHWACGWLEIILVAPDTPEAEKAHEIESSLENYPVLDEMDYSEREYEAMQEYWTDLSIAERVDLCQKYDESIFSARSDFPPEIVEERIRDRHINY